MGEAHSVVVAGGGPTGMMLAAELALAGVDVVVVERRADQRLEASRSGGLHCRTIEVLDQRGVADRFVAAGRPAQVQSFAGIPLDISDFPTRHPHGLALWQADFEPILAGWVAELGVPTRRGCEITGFAAAGDGVDVHLAGGEVLRAGYLVGCDGGRSTVRNAAGVGFPGWDPTVSSMLAEVEMTDPPAPVVRRDADGQHAVGPVGDGVHWRVVVSAPYPGPRPEPTLEDLRAGLVRVWGTDFGVHRPSWISRFTDAARQAASYRAGRVLLAGDAAHVHYPVGGQGLNLGIQDAVNLGWKLAAVAQGRSPQSLLDTYQDERHPVAARVLRNTMAQTVLLRGDDHTDALRATMTDLLAMDEPRRRFGAMVAGLDIRYDLGDGHPLVGRRMPDLDLITASGPTRVFELLHDARPLLLDLGLHAGADPAGAGAAHPLGGESGGEFGGELAGAYGVRWVVAACDGPWELPAVGPVPAPRAVLVRPDGHVAWAGETSDPELARAAARWFGPGE